MNIVVNIVSIIIFIISLFKTVELASVFFNQGRQLTKKGHKHLGIALTGLIISGLQLFNIFDFIKFIIQ